MGNRPTSRHWLSAPRLSVRHDHDLYTVVVLLYSVRAQNNNIARSFYRYRNFFSNFFFFNRFSCALCFCFQDYELEQKMEFEMKMREGTTRLLAACKHQTQSLQAAKSLLTSNERMTAYIAELHRKSREPPQ